MDIDVLADCRKNFFKKLKSRKTFELENKKKKQTNEKTKEKKH